MTTQLQDKEQGQMALLIDQTSNSYLVKLFKTNPKGIDCTHWFEYKEFHKRFELTSTQQKKK